MTAALHGDRRRRPPRRTWRWRLRYTRANGRPADDPFATRDEAEQDAARLLGQGFAPALVYVDRGGWETPYAIRGHTTLNEEKGGGRDGDHQ